MPSLPPEKASACITNARDLFGTGYIFERRTRAVKRLLRILTFTGVAGPASLGALLAAYGLQWQYLPTALSITIGLMVVQFIISLWSLVNQWDSDLAYALESTASNYRLSEGFYQIARSDESKAKVEKELSALEAEARVRTEMDFRQGITDKEKRRGMKAALRQFQLKCVGCEITPLSLRSTNCDVCGKFRIWNL